MPGGAMRLCPRRNCDADPSSEEIRRRGEHRRRVVKRLRSLPGGVLLQWRQVGGRWSESPAGRQTPNARDDVCKPSS
eukprot:4260064-Pyramimonas_sp.AAC.1